MKPADRPPARTSLLKAALAATGAVFFVIAIALPAPWAYAVGALLLAACVIPYRRPPR
ncbi:hypothetical protein ACFY3O_11285 [Streptomyces sp. NPDC001046]|uniref:hypothetical protein n=1 Tax=unclassified Streptomyces TaxID=2593676 RepID=UPI003643D384